MISLFQKKDFIYLISLSSSISTAVMIFQDINQDRLYLHMKVKKEVFHLS